MAGADPQIEWYIARDGKQYGPLTDLEMRKFVELGHLRPTDLVWRYGFPDWRAAPAVFPTTIPPRPEPQRQAYRPQSQTHYPQHDHRQAQRDAPRERLHARAEPARATTAPVAVSEPYEHDLGDDDDFEDDFQPERPRRRWRRFAIATILVAVLGGALWLAMDLIPSPTRLVALIQNPAALVNLFGGESSSAADNKSDSPEVTRTAAIGNDQIEAAFQQGELWQLLKEEFPDWYDEQLQQVARLRAEGADRSLIARRLAEAVVALRKQNAKHALAASPETLHEIADSFLNNLQHLSQQSDQVCYGFISHGELSPHVVELMGVREHAEVLQRLPMAVFKAIVEGRRSPQMHLPPRQSDYQEVKQALIERGWTDREMQLFSHPTALGQAPPQVVCKLVQDWFAAQLSLSDENVQLRLLYESLRPVVGG